MIRSRNPDLIWLNENYTTFKRSVIKARLYDNLEDTMNELFESMVGPLNTLSTAFARAGMSFKQFSKQFTQEPKPE